MELVKLTPKHGTFVFSKAHSLGCLELSTDLEKGTTLQPMVGNIFGLSGKLQAKLYPVFNRPGVAGAVLQTPPILINSLTHSVMVC